MIFPPVPCAIIRSAAACRHQTTPNTLTSNIRARSSRVISRRVLTCAMPAFATITSTLPSSRAARSTSANTASRSVTSAGTAIALPPAPVISSATPSAVDLSRSFTATVCPSRASLSAIARPMPRPAPVTTAVVTVSPRPAGAPPSRQRLLRGHEDLHVLLLLVDEFPEPLVNQPVQADPTRDELLGVALAVAQPPDRG